jgi:hypothetical protein
LPASLTVTASSGQSKTYGTNDPASGFTYSLSGLVSGDSVSGNLGRAAGENVATYAYNLGNFAPADPDNYTTTLTPGTFAIAAATLTIIPTPGQSKVYHSTDPVFSYRDNVVNGVTPAYWNSSGVYVNAATINDTVSGTLGRAPGENVGSYAYTIGTVAPSTPANYIINTSFFVTNPFAITPAPLTLTGVIANNKIFDNNTLASLNFNSATLSGVYLGDTVTLNTADYNANFITANIGNNIPVVVANLDVTGASAGNYQLIQPTGLTANITPANPPIPPNPNIITPQYQIIFPVNLMSQQLVEQAIDRDITSNEIKINSKSCVSIGSLIKICDIKHHILSDSTDK